MTYLLVSDSYGDISGYYFFSSLKLLLLDFENGGGEEEEGLGKEVVSRKMVFIFAHHQSISLEVIKIIKTSNFKIKFNDKVLRQDHDKILGMVMNRSFLKAKFDVSDCTGVSMQEEEIFHEKSSIFSLIPLSADIYDANVIDVWNN